MVAQQSVPTGERRSPMLSCRFPPTPRSVASVRRLVAAHLDDMEPACQHAIVPIASELATNAVLHAGTPYFVELYLSDVVRIEVTDSAAAAPFMRVVSRDATSGRGLFIVAQLSARWGVDWLDESKVVWAEVPRC
jgi:hypothetical protein